MALPSSRRVDTLRASIVICSEVHVRGSASARSSSVTVPPARAKWSTVTSSGPVVVPEAWMRSEKLNSPVGNRTTRTVESLRLRSWIQIRPRRREGR